MGSSSSIDPASAPDTGATPADDLAAMDRAADDAMAGDPAPSVGNLPTDLIEQNSAAKEYAELIAVIVYQGAAILAPRWEITRQEAQSLGEAYGPLVAKHFPDGLGAWELELQAAAITAMIFAPRIGKPRKDSEPEKSEQPQSTDAPDPAPPRSDNGEIQVDAGAMPAGVDA